MSLKRLPRDDLAVAKPVDPRALALVSDFARFDPPEFDSPQPDHGVASCYEALREDTWLHVVISRFKPIAHLGVPAQPRPAWSLEHNLGIVQRKKLVNVVPPIEEFDPSASDCDVLLRHVPHAISWGTSGSRRGEIPVVHARDQRRHQSAVLLLPRRRQHHLADRCRSRLVGTQRWLGVPARSQTGSRRPLPRICAVRDPAMADRDHANVPVGIRELVDDAIATDPQ